MSSALSFALTSAGQIRPLFSRRECSPFSMTLKFSRQLSRRFPLIWCTTSSGVKERPSATSTRCLCKGICFPFTRILRYLARIFSSGMYAFGPFRRTEFLHPLHRESNPSGRPACLQKADSSSNFRQIEQIFIYLLLKRSRLNRSFALVEGAPLDTASRDKQQYEKVANTLDKGIVPQKGNQWGK